MANWNLGNILPVLGEGTYTVTAEIAGTTEVSTPVTFVVDVTGPGTVSGLTVSVSGGNPLLQWSALGASDLALYEVWRRPTSGGASAFLASTSSTSYLDASATSGVQYAYKVRGKDTADNFSPFSAEVTTSTTPATVSPPVWATGYPQAAAGGAFIFSWSHPNPTGQNVTHYLIESKQEPSGAFTQIIDQYPGVNAFMGGFTPGTSYTFRIRAQNSGGTFSSYTTSSPIVALGAGGTDTTPPVPPPTSPGAAAIAGGQAIVTWVASTSSDVAEYGVWRRREDEVSFTEVATVPVSSPRSFTDTGLSAGFLYSYKINATDTSDNVSATFSGETTVMALAGGAGGLPRVSINATRDGFVAGGRTFLPAGFHISNLATSWGLATGNWPNIVSAFTEMAEMGANIVRVGVGGNAFIATGLGTANPVASPLGQELFGDVLDLCESLGLYAIPGVGGIGLGVGSPPVGTLRDNLAAGTTSFIWSPPTGSTNVLVSGSGQPQVSVGDYLRVGPHNGLFDIVKIGAVSVI
jgi:chitodextrinase